MRKEKISELIHRWERAFWYGRIS